MYGTSDYCRHAPGRPARYFELYLQIQLILKHPVIMKCILKFWKTLQQRQKEEGAIFEGKLYADNQEIRENRY